MIHRRPHAVNDLIHQQNVNCSWYYNDSSVMTDEIEKESDKFRQYISFFVIISKTSHKEIQFNKRKGIISFVKSYKICESI